MLQLSSIFGTSRRRSTLEDDVRRFAEERVHISNMGDVKITFWALYRAYKAWCANGVAPVDAVAFNDAFLAVCPMARRDRIEMTYFYINVELKG